MSARSTARIVSFPDGAPHVPETRRPSIVSPLDPSRRIQAVLFDLDGTLYDQRRMRRTMAMELLTLPLTRPFSAVKTWRGLSAYRHAQEALRGTERAGQAGKAGRGTEGTENAEIDAQLNLAAVRCGIPSATLKPIVQEWMFRRPLKHMRACRAAGVVQLLTFLADAGLELGVLSDYPAQDKLAALGVDRFFPTVLCTTDPQIGAFKPDPRGFLEASRRWGIAPAEVLVVGDRLDADAAGAAAAGMPCVIVGRSVRAESAPEGVLVFSSLERLYRVLVDDKRR